MWSLTTMTVHIHRRKHRQPEAVRHPLPTSPRVDSTEQISRAFLKAIETNDSDQLRSTFASSMNSLAAVLGANASDRLDGERIYLNDFLVDAKYDSFREKPTTVNPKNR